MGWYTSPTYLTAPSIKHNGPAVARKSSLFTNISSTFTFPQRSVANGQKQQQPAILNSGVFPDAPPVLVRATKLRKYVDTDEVAQGLYDSPYH
ncbi:hypothetical protein Tco_1177712 [Tanacetum coccineum]